MHFPASKQTQRLANRFHSSILSKIVRYTSPFKTFRRINANFTPLYMQNVVHTFSSTKKRPKSRKSQSFVDFGENCASFHSRLKYLLRLNANFTPFCMQNVVNTFASTEKRPKTRKSQSFVDFDENCALFLSRLKYFDV